jgi:hypothetical protein
LYFLVVSLCLSFNILLKAKDQPWTNKQKNYYIHHSKSTWY